MSIVLVGVNHKTAPIEVRELLAFSDEGCTDGLRRLVDGEVVREGLIVSTCNRVEILVPQPPNNSIPGPKESRNSSIVVVLCHKDSSTSISTATGTKKPFAIYSGSLHHLIRWLLVNLKC